jgi:NitT/TauT family transport system permease protein
VNRQFPAPDFNRLVVLLPRRTARLAFGFSWRVSLVAETIGSSSGVGYRLRQAADLIRTDQVFAWTMTLVIMMATIEMGLLKPLETYLFRWKKGVEM